MNITLHLGFWMIPLGLAVLAILHGIVKIWGDSDDNLPGGLEIAIAIIFSLSYIAGHFIR